MMLVLDRKQSEVVFVTVPPSSEPQVIAVSLIHLGKSRAKIGFSMSSEAIQIRRKEAATPAEKNVATPVDVEQQMLAWRALGWRPC